MNEWVSALLADPPRPRPRRTRQGTSALPDPVAIPSSAGPDYIGAIAVLAALAYPSRSEISKRRELERACKAHLCKAYLARGGDRVKIRHEFSGYPNRRIERQFSA